MSVQNCITDSDSGEKAKIVRCYTEDTEKFSKIETVMRDLEEEKAESLKVIERERKREKMKEEGLIAKALKSLDILDNETDRVVFDMNLSEYYERFLKDGCPFGYKQLFTSMRNTIFSLSDLECKDIRDELWKEEGSHKTKTIIMKYKVDHIPFFTQTLCIKNVTLTINQ